MRLHWIEQTNSKVLHGVSKLIEDLSLGSFTLCQATKAIVYLNGMNRNIQSNLQEGKINEQLFNFRW